MTDGAMTSSAIIAVCLGGLGLIVWYRVQQARLSSVRYMDRERAAALLLSGGVGLAYCAIVAVMLLAD